MNSHERAERLFVDAAKQGLDGPTEGQVADAIHDAEEAVWQDIQMVFLGSKRPEIAAWLDKVRDRRLDGGEVAPFEEPAGERADRIKQGRLQP